MRPRMGRVLDGLDRALDHAVLNHEFDFHFRQEVDHIFGAAIKLRMPLLSAKAANVSDGHALKADLLQRFFDVVELEGFDDGFDLFS